MKIKIFFIIIICFGCNSKNNSLINKPETIEVDLESSIDNEFKFLDIRYTDFPIYSQEIELPKIYKQKREKLQIIKAYKDAKIVSTIMQKPIAVYYQYQYGYLNKEEFIKSFIRPYINIKDTTIIKNNGNIKFELNAISGFKNNFQYVIPDLNNNGKFSDDNTFYFPKGFYKNTFISNEVLDTLPLLNFKYQLLDNGNIYNVNRKIKIFPASNHNNNYIPRINLVDSMLNKYTLMLKLIDYKKGHLKKDNSNYTIAIQGKSQGFAIVIKPDSIIKNLKNNFFTQSFFEYKEKDTLKLGNEWYVIDNITPDMSKINFKKLETINVLNEEKFSLTKPVKNIILSGLDGVKINLLEENSKQKYIFIDFWGTWCAPCKDLTPEIVKLHKSYGNKIKFLSIAYDKDINEVKKYVTESKMNWTHVFVNSKEKENSIIEKWNISRFPTFILIDRTGKILYGGNTTSDGEFEKIFKSLP